MGRQIKDIRWLSDAPIKDIEPKPWMQLPDEADKAIDNWRAGRTSYGPSQIFRQFSPYQPGDVIIGPNGLCRVSRIYAEFRDRRGDWIIKYRVQYITKRGKWSKVFNDLYPVFIQRAYEAAA